MKFEEIPAVDHVWAMTELFRRCPRHFTTRFSFLELWAIYRAHALATRPRLPHRWTPIELRAALRGLALTPK